MTSATLELYLPPGADADRVMVLDNDLPVYRTTVADVALRKSPTVKEMISIRNVMRILNDADVVVSKKAETVAGVQQACIAGLDLRHTPADIEALAFDGRAAMENRYAEGVIETIDLFAELLAYQGPPKAFDAAHHHIRGHRPHAGTPAVYGPLVAYSRVHHHIRWIDTPLDSADPDQIDRYRRIIEGQAPPAAEGPAVFQALVDRVLSATT